MTSEPARPSTEVEAPDEREASEPRHQERCSEVQRMSDEEGNVQRDDEEESRAAKPARDLEHHRQQRSPSMPFNTGLTVGGVATA